MVCDDRYLVMPMYSEDERYRCQPQLDREISNKATDLRAHSLARVVHLYTTHDKDRITSPIVDGTLWTVSVLARTCTAHP
jgi:hypothetical protein